MTASVSPGDTLNDTSLRFCTAEPGYVNDTLSKAIPHDAGPSAPFLSSGSFPRTSSILLKEARDLGMRRTIPYSIMNDDTMSRA